jgi:tyrosyl-tRNA synthetase
LGNAIGINEPPAEMYGKLMSISDELMWKYWLLLTDLRQSEIDTLREEVVVGVLHPMEVKKRLARTITADFHGEAAAQIADENWAKMFQQKETALLPTLPAKSRIRFVCPSCWLRSASQPATPRPAARSPRRPSSWMAKAP